MRRITYRKVAAVAMAAALSAALLVGCGSTAASTDSAAASTVADESTAEDAEKAADEGDADEVAAKNCADLIDAIYVQERSADTDAQCEAAKAAWDALTDTQKELVEGENADPDYFGRDTGDAGKDDPRNADDIGENELLVVSFGTSFNGSRAADIKGVEDALQAAYPDWSVRRAFTAQIIIDKLAERDGIVIDNFEQAMDKLVEEGVQKVIVQPTHLMAGYEYTDVLNSLQSNYADKFEAIVLGDPLLTSDEDYSEVVEAICDATAEYDDGQTAICFMGHGTEADSNEDYTHLQQVLTDAGHTSYFVGTVEATPTFDDVVEAAQAAGFTKAVLRPLMVVAGDHANNDMADTEDPDSFASKFIAAGFEVECVVEGLGQLVAIDDIYVRHVADAITQL